MTITDEIWTRCESCGMHYDEDGNVTFDQPSRESINTEGGTCPRCIRELTRLGVPIFQNRGGKDRRRGDSQPPDCGERARAAVHAGLNPAGSTNFSKSSKHQPSALRGTQPLTWRLPLVLAFKNQVNETK